MLYNDISNEEYDEQPKGPVEDKILPFLDLPVELSGVELAIHHEEVPPVAQPDLQAEVEIQTRVATTNAGCRVDHGRPK
jgi:hypothetical protein